MKDVPKSVPDIDAFEAWAGEVYERIPPKLLEGLNGGILIEESAHKDEEIPDVYILGEYIEDPYLGYSIVLYYGSFVALFAEESIDVWREEIEETMLHEVRHHVERRAGLFDLDLEDMRELEAFRRDAENRRRSG